MTGSAVFRGALCAALVACGGVTAETHSDASSESSAGCPSELSKAVGTACTNDGLTCGGDKCTNACSFCNIIRCTSGVWTQEEAFPDPSCNDSSTTCTYPPTNNDSQCPPSYSVGDYQKPCSPVGLTCAYPGAGDTLANGCNATAMMWCKGDAGTGAWVVAQ